MLIGLDGVGRQIGGRILFRDATLVLRPGDRIGLVGPNGAGKTTLLRMIARDEPCDFGEISVGRGVRIGMLRQEIDPSLERSVCDEAASAMGRLDELEAEMRQLELAMTRHGELGEDIPDALAIRYDRVSGEFTHGGGFEREARVAAVLAGLGFDEEARTRPLNSFSGGWLMRVELAKLFLFDFPRSSGSRRRSMIFAARSWWSPTTGPSCGATSRAWPRSRERAASGSTRGTTTAISASARSSGRS